MTQYLLQRGTNRIYIATEGLLKRKAGDMVPVDTETINARIAATKRQIEEKKLLLNMKKGEGVPQDIEDGAKALKALQEDLADVDRQIAEAEKENTPLKERVPETTDDLDEKAFANMVENDKAVIQIKGMRKARVVADWIEANYGIKQDVEQIDVDKLKDQAIALRTGTLKESFNSK